MKSNIHSRFLWFRLLVIRPVTATDSPLFSISEASQPLCRYLSSFKKCFKKNSSKHNKKKIRGSKFEAKFKKQTFSQKSKISDVWFLSENWLSDSLYLGMSIYYKKTHAICDLPPLPRSLLAKRDTIGKGSWGANVA